MKTFTIILSLFMLFKPVLPVLEYVVFYDYIKNELCVNKEKPELECNGKCHLKKGMAKAAGSENTKEKHRFSVIDNHISVYQEMLFSQNQLLFLQSISKKIFFFYRIDYTFSFSYFIFRPPVLK
ncbi:MAG: hypothetical protein RSF68_01905 [Myroides sp.]